MSGFVEQNYVLRTKKELRKNKKDEEKPRLRRFLFGLRREGNAGGFELQKESLPHTLWSFGR